MSIFVSKIKIKTWLRILSVKHLEIDMFLYQFSSSFKYLVGSKTRDFKRYDEVESTVNFYLLTIKYTIFRKRRFTLSLLSVFLLSWLFSQKSIISVQFNFNNKYKYYHKLCRTRFTSVLQPKHSFTKILLDIIIRSHFQWIQISFPIGWQWLGPTYLTTALWSDYPWEFAIVRLMAKVMAALRHKPNGIEAL